MRGLVGHNVKHSFSLIIYPAFATEARLADGLLRRLAGRFLAARYRHPPAIDVDSGSPCSNTDH